jgi:hypothetical protein
MPTSAQITALLKEMYKLSPNHAHAGLQDKVGLLKSSICKTATDLGIIPQGKTGPARDQHLHEAGQEFQLFLRSFCEAGVYSIDAFLAD